MALVDAWFADKQLEGKTVLVVDDTLDNLILIEAYLRSSGVTIETASNGIEALDKIKSKRFDLVVMDIQMPTLDGIEVTTILRMRGFEKPIIACTAFGDGGSLLGEGSEFNAYLAKPLTRTNLLDCLTKLIEPSRND